MTSSMFKHTHTSSKSSLKGDDVSWYIHSCIYVLQLVDVVEAI